MKERFNNAGRTKLIVLSLMGIVLFALLIGVGYVYAVSPAAIRQPEPEHAHLRMQLVVNNQPVNLGESKYQTPYVKDQCAGELSAEPIHLHDNQDQFVHLHWKDITGGMVLKNYGYNLIGGPDDLLGYRLDSLPRIATVKIFGTVLPELPDNAQLWIYSGDERGYVQKTREEFLDQTLEQFFGVESLIVPEEEQAHLLDPLFPTAYAHGNEIHAQEAPRPVTDTPSEEELRAINNLLGNVVIFAQENKPSDAQVKAQFEALTPLTTSTCGG